MRARARARALRENTRRVSHTRGHARSHEKGYARRRAMNMHERQNDKIVRISASAHGVSFFSDANARVAREDATAKHALNVETNEPLASICDV